MFWIIVFVLFVDACMVLFALEPLNRYRRAYCEIAVRTGCTLHYFTWFGLRKTSSAQVLDTIRSALDLFEQRVGRVLFSDAHTHLRVVRNWRWISRAKAVEFPWIEAVLPERYALNQEYWFDEFVHLRVNQFAFDLLDVGRSRPDWEDTWVGQLKWLRTLLLRDRRCAALRHQFAFGVRPRLLSPPPEALEANANDTAYFRNRTLAWILLHDLMRWHRVSLTDVARFSPDRFPVEVDLAARLALRWTDYVYMRRWEMALSS